MKVLNLPLLAISTFGFSSLPAVAELHFDPAMISIDLDTVADLSLFESGGKQLPGSYDVDIYLNGRSVALRTLNFIQHKDQVLKEKGVRDSTGLMACLNRKDLADMGVDISSIPALALLKDDICISPGEFIPQAFTTFNFQKMRLDISIPQAALQSRVRGWISSERWEEGVNAAMLSYQFSGSENHGRYGNSSSHYLNLVSGFNMGAWRLRDNSTWTDHESRYGSMRRWQHLNTYVQRAIIPWRSEMTAGDSTTGSDVFDSLPFRGVHIATDDNMYPDTMRGFAPEIRGTAASSARVSVRQNGNIIYQTTVAAGAFVIKDLYPVSTGGDLDVTITEAGGSVQTFSVPYSSLPVLQRKGRVSYGITAGQYRNTSDRYTAPYFTQGTLLWGLPNNITVYGGAQLADRYRALALGTGLNLGAWGAVSADITQAHSMLSDGSKYDGHSLRFLYGRSLVSTGTTFKLVGYRYSTQGFNTLEDTALKSMSGWMYDMDEVDASGRLVKRNGINYYDLHSNKRDRLQANISQRIGYLGSLYLAATHQTYWQDVGSTDSLQAGFSGTLGQASYNVSYGYSHVSGQSKPDRTLYLSLSVPLDTWMSRSGSHNMRVTYSASRDASGKVINQAGLGGTALDDSNLSWSATQGYGRRDGDSGDLSLDYQGGYGNLSAGYGYSSDYRQVRYGVSGSAVLHSEGLTMGQPLGTTNVLIAAPGASGVSVENGKGIRTDWRGYTVVPYASMYRENRVALDVSQLDGRTDIDNPVTHVVPTRGALARADFKALTGRRTMMTLTHNGRLLPFGTTVISTYGISSGIVGDGGQVWLSGLQSQGELKAQWGKGPDQQCRVRYHLPEQLPKQVFVAAQEVCR